MSKKVTVEIDLDLTERKYDIRFKKLSKGEDFEMDYWELREIIIAAFTDLEQKIKNTNGTAKTFSKVFLH